MASATGETTQAVGVVETAQYKPDDEAVVILRLKDWQELLGPQKKEAPDNQAGRF